MMCMANVGSGKTNSRQEHNREWIYYLIYSLRRTEPLVKSLRRQKHVPYNWRATRAGRGDCMYSKYCRILFSLLRVQRRPHRVTVKWWGALRCASNQEPFPTRCNPINLLCFLSFLFISFQFFPSPSNFATSYGLKRFFAAKLF